MAVRSLVALCFAAAVLWSGAVLAETTEPRVALVIGNSAYGGELGNLANPANDARLMATSLRKVGFEVIELEDANQKQMRRAIVDFGEALAKAGGQATGLFYYAGHGLQVGGDNYLIPIGAEIHREGDVDVEAVAGDLVLKQMDFAGNAVNIVILDACRNNPLSRGFRSQLRGLAEQKVKPRGSFIAYSTAPGDVAADGAGDNSPYTTALSEAIQKPGAALEEVFRDVRSRVMAATQQKQVPWDSSSLTAPFYFIPPAETASAEPPPPPAAPTGDSKAVELAYWNAIATSSNPAMFQSYLKRYPNGEFADLAAAKLDELKQAAEPSKPRTPASSETESEIAELDATYVAAQSANVRAAPSTEAKILKRLRAGDTVQVTGQVKGKDWYRVSVDDETGFVNAVLLITEAQAKAQETAAAVAPPSPPAQPTEPVQPSVQAGQSFRDCSGCPEMVAVPAGSFVMGAANGETGILVNESPQRNVTLARPFAVGKFEVTIGEFAAFIRESGYDPGNSCYVDSASSSPGVNWHNPGYSGYAPGERDPVVCVSWDGAKAYADWLSKKTGKHYRLLTEAEWEYAARAGSSTMFPWGTDPNAACAYANVADIAGSGAPWWRTGYSGVNCNDAGGYSVPVGRYRPNAFGLYDMIGNANEWVADCYFDGYAAAPTDGSAMEMTGCQQRAVRGGGWSSSPYLVRAAARTYAPPNARLNVDGFRVARDL